LSNVNGLVNITSADRDLMLSNNGLTSVSGLQNLQSVGGRLLLNGNNLTSLDGLENLTSVSRRINISGNPSLVDISALSGTVMSNGFDIDGGQYTTKAAASSTLCQYLSNNTYLINGGSLSDVCEP